MPTLWPVPANSGDCGIGSPNCRQTTESTRNFPPEHGTVPTSAISNPRAKGRTDCNPSSQILETLGGKLVTEYLAALNLF